MFDDLPLNWCKLETLRYAAPEHFVGDTPEGFTPLMRISDPSKMGDIYSIGMASFNVRFSATNHPTA